MASAVVLATAGYDHKIRFWEASREKCVRMLRYPDSQVNALSITNDKQYIAAVGNPHARIFEVQSQNNNPVISYDAHQGNVTCVGFQCDAKWMFTGSEDKTIRIWDLRAPRWQRQYECPAAVTSVALHPNQTELISGDQNGNVRVWDLQANGCMQEIVPDGDVPIRSVAVASDASMVVAGNNSAKVFAWQPSSGEYTPKSLTETRHDGYLLKCVISPDVTRLVTCSSDKTVKIWNLNSDRLDDMDPAHAHVDPAVPPPADATAQAAGHAASAASGTTSEPAMAAENPDAAPVAPQGQGGDPRVPPSAAHPPPAPGAGAGGMAGGEGVGVGGGVGVPVIAPGGGPAGFPLEKTLTSHQRWVWDACFSADSAYLVTASSDFTAKLWDVQTGEVIRHYTSQMAMTCVALNDSST